MPVTPRMFTLASLIAFVLLIVVVIWAMRRLR
jgi:flagellar biogenesis protein FliO